MRVVIGLIAFLVFSFCFPFVKTVSAAFSFDIASVSAATITSGNQEVDIELDITSLPSGDSYFRVALQKESGSYFGYIKDNNGGWATIQTLNGDCTIYYKVNDISITSLVLKFKVGDDASIDNGNYKLRAHRFTSTCKSYTEAENFNNFIIAMPTPTPFPTNTPMPTPTFIPTATPTSVPTPTKTPTPMPSNTPTPTLKPTLTPTKTPTPTPSRKIIPTSILGESTESAETVLSADAESFDEDKLASKPKNKNSNWPQKIFIGIGGIFLIACAILSFRFYIKNKKQGESKIL